MNLQLGILLAPQAFPVARLLSPSSDSDDLFIESRLSLVADSDDCGIEGVVSQTRFSVMSLDDDIWSLGKHRPFNLKLLLGLDCTFYLPIL
jgi:hypothetical protein